MKRFGAWWLAAGLLLALALRAGYAWRHYRELGPGERRDIMFDPESYDKMALRLLDRGEFLGNDGQPMTDREPLYPLTLAAAHAVFGRSLAVGIGLNVVFGLLTCLAVYFLTLELWGDAWAARLAFAAACVFPEWVYYGAFLFRETMTTLLLALWAWSWSARERWGLPRAFLAAGVCFGALSVVRSPLAPVGAAFCALAAWRLSPRLWPRTIGVFALCAVLFQAPWIWRNYRLTHRLVAGSTMGGSVMYLSLLADYDHPEIPFEAPLNGPDPVINEVKNKGLGLAQGESIFYHACLDVFRHDPRRFWGAFFHKAAKLWRPYPHQGWDYGQSFGFIELVGACSNVPLLALGLLGLVFARRRGRSADFLMLIPAVMTVVYGLFWSTTRYHSPLMFVFMPLAALALRDIRRTAA